MAFTGSAICNSYKTELFSGTHTSAHTYKICLLTSAASPTKSTTNYSQVSANEVGNSGTYAAGGATLATFTAALYTDTATLDWTVDPSWTGATITARGALIYNSTASGAAVAVIDFGSDIACTSGTFTVTFPAAAAATALLRIA